VAQGELPDIPGITEATRKGNAHTLHLSPETTPQAVLQQLANSPNLTIESFERALPTMDDIFVRVVKNEIRD
jgi:ABC-2 type transport system ATP-binding protein